MKRMNILQLDIKTSTRLNALQNEVDSYPSYAQQVQAGKVLWESGYAKVKHAKNAVKETLRKMCAPLERCNYCEDSCGDEVEHIQPKNLYPELTFVWDNHLLACGPCNSPKRNKYAVFNAQNQIIDVTRKKGAPVVPPVSGNPLLINPRNEEPMEYLILDIGETFYFVPIADDDKSILYRRAQYTIDLLKLNSRAFLVKSRRSAFHNYLSHFEQYVESKGRKASKSKLQQKKECLLLNPHSTVWEEMKRQKDSFDHLNDLFSEAPEALYW